VLVIKPSVTSGITTPAHCYQFFLTDHLQNSKTVLLICLVTT